MVRVRVRVTADLLLVLVPDRVELALLLPPLELDQRVDALVALPRELLLERLGVRLRVRAWVKARARVRVSLTR